MTLLLHYRSGFGPVFADLTHGPSPPQACQDNLGILTSGRLPFLQPVLFAPLGHEYLIQAGNRREWSGTPLLAPSERGVKLLAVLPGSPAPLQGPKRNSLACEHRAVPLTTYLFPH